MPHSRANPMVEQWTPALVGGYDFLVSLVGVARMIVALGMTKLEFLDTILCLFARLREPGVRDGCLLQYREAARTKHDKVTRYMLDSGIALFGDDSEDESRRDWHGTSACRRVRFHWIYPLSSAI